jgi:hypothetical protein
MPVGEVLQRMGSRELAEWIVELGTLRPEEEREAYRVAREQAEAEEHRRPMGPVAPYQGQGALGGMPAFPQGDGL